MNSIKVIALNDDNHSKSYVTLGSYYSNCADFMKHCLLNPHTVTYRVKEVYICDPQGELANMSEEEFQRLFDLLDQDPVTLYQRDQERWEERNAAFELFWKNGDTWNYA